MNAIHTIAKATITECIRSRVLILTLLFTVGLIIVSVGLANIALGQRVRIVTDIGTTSASLVGSMIAIALVTTRMAADIRHRTMDAILVRPIARSTYLVGRALGFWCVMIILTSIMLFSTLGIILGLGHSPSMALIVTFPMVWSEMAVVVGLSVLFNTMSKPALASAFAAGTIIAANFSDQVLTSVKNMQTHAPILSRALRLLYHAIPDLASMSLRTEAANRLVFSPNKIIFGVAYGLCYAALTVTLASSMFNKKRS